MIKKLFIGIIIIISLIVFPHQAFALVGAYEGVSPYSSWMYPPCVHGDRAGAEYCNNLRGMLENVAFPNTYFTFYNALANESHITSGEINNADFYVYSGHGHNYQYESSAHFYARSTGESWHDSTMEDYSSVNASTNEARFGGLRLKWVTMYSCNWLTNNGNFTKLDNIFKTFEGATLTMGFASIMYLDSREGTLYGENIKNKMSFRSAFIEATKRYQTQRINGDSIVRVQGLTAAKDDTYEVYTGIQPPSRWYKNNPSLYSVISTITIKHDSVPIP